VIFHDADDLQSVVADGMAERVLAWKKALGECFIDDGDVRRTMRIRIGEVAASENPPGSNESALAAMHAEAMAYARWAGKSLPSEEQWHRAAYGTLDGSERKYPWGTEEPSSSFGNFDFGHWNPTPVNAFPKGQSAFGVQDLLGNGWEWTSTVFAPFNGFEPFPFYRGYSSDFFDGKHFVMKGGSPRTAGCMLRPTFRNWFQTHYQYVYAGFRCVNH